MTRPFSQVITVVLVLFCASLAFARSPAGTPEYEAESKALSMLARDFPAYKPLDAQMRGNQLSIAIPAKNRAGNRVDFKAYVRRVNIRGGGYRYEVSAPQFGSQ